MRPTRRVVGRLSTLDVVDGVFFAYSSAAALWLAYLLLRDGVRPGWPALLLVVFWVFFSYLVLPRLHRILTRVYVPGYFIGRTRTSDGLLGDPVNLGLRGDEGAVHVAMSAAGWTRADDLGLSTSLRTITSTLRRRSYPEAPVSPLHLFDRQQDFAYQREVKGSPLRRHHVRFWRCPDGWLLPGGFAVDWLAAGTFDRSVGLSLFTLQVTHRIAEDTDVERDHIVSTVQAASPAVGVDVIASFSSGYHARNGGGDRILTDGDLPILDVRRLAASPDAVARRTDSRDRRPWQTVFGVGVALARGVAYLLTLVVLLLDRDPDPYLVPVLAVAAVIDLGLAFAVLAGRNWARLVLMTACAVTVATYFVSSVGTAHQRVGLAELPAVGGSILVLLSLSSHRAREYAARRSTRGGTP
jgi:hypothetical protein